MTQLFPDAPAGLGRMMVGGAGKVARRADDFYPTPADVTDALLAADGGFLLGHAPARTVWEPCAGDGAISDRLVAAGFQVIETDRTPRRAGMMQQDVLLARRAPARAVVTNPPFALALEIAEHLLFDLKVDYLALLLKATWWHAAERQALWARRAPTVIYPLTWRPDFTAGGAPTMDCAWMVWRTDTPGAGCRYQPLARPVTGQEALL